MEERSRGNQTVLDGHGLLPHEKLADIIWAFEGSWRYDVLIGKKEGNMTWRGRVKGGVVVLEEGSSLVEGSEVLIEAFPTTEADHELALTELKAKLERASANADKDEFFTPDQVLGQIAELRQRRRGKKS